MKANVTLSKAELFFIQSVITKVEIIPTGILFIVLILSFYK